MILSLEGGVWLDCGLCVISLSSPYQLQTEGGELMTGCWIHDPIDDPHIRKCRIPILEVQDLRYATPIRMSLLFP